jgi:hypothetical protein
MCQASELCSWNRNRNGDQMGLGGSLFLIAVGAILRWAVSATTSGVNLQTVGLILLIVGGIGLVISLIWMAFIADRTPRARNYPDGPSDVPQQPPRA